MDTQSTSSRPHSLMKLVFGLGLASVLILVLAVIAGLLIPTIGISDFLPLAMLTGLVGLVIWLLTRSRESTVQEKQLGRIGLILGCCGLGIAILMRLLVFVFFLPWLGA